MIQREESNTPFFLDESWEAHEQLPRKFTVTFRELKDSTIPRVQVWLDNVQVGDTVDDNCFENDFYRYHDIFHYTFATLLGWSPCTRSMMKRKRKSDYNMDRVEDGARAAITEEAISLIIFNEAKRKKYFANGEKINRNTLKIVKEMTESFEVKKRTFNEWETAIIKAYEVFRKLIRNGGGQVEFNMNEKQVKYSLLQS